MTSGPLPQVRGRGGVVPSALPAAGPAARTAASGPGSPHAHPEQQTHPFPRVRGARAVLYEGYSVYEVTPRVHDGLRRLPRTHSVVYNVIPRAECYGPHKVFCATVLQAVQAQAAMVCVTACATACATAVRCPLPGPPSPGVRRPGHRHLAPAPWVGLRWWRRVSTCGCTYCAHHGCGRPAASRQYVWLGAVPVLQTLVAGCRAVLQARAASPGTASVGEDRGVTSAPSLPDRPADRRVEAAAAPASEAGPCVARPALT